MRTRKKFITFLLAAVSCLPKIQGQADNLSSSDKLTFSKQSPQSQELSSSNPNGGKVVLSEVQNHHCFKASVYEDDGDLLTLHCLPGYGRSGENESCSGPHGCCHCTEGTYMPHANDCFYCIMKTFCHDYGLEYEDYGSSTNNSKCGAQIQQQQDYTPSIRVTEVQSTMNSTAVGFSENSSSCNTEVQSTSIPQQAGDIALEHWIYMHPEVFVVMFVTVMLTGILLLVAAVAGVIWLMYFCIWKGNNSKRPFSCYELKKVGKLSDDHPSEADELTGNRFEDEAAEGSNV